MTFALGQDNAFGQPLESQLRSCLLADAMCRQAGLDESVRATTYWLSLLRYVGCTGHAHEISTVFGDDVAILAATLVFDAGDPADVGRTMMQFATAGHPPEEHAEIVRTIQDSGHDWAVHNFATGCEVGAMLIHRLGSGPTWRPRSASRTNGGTGQGSRTARRATRSRCPCGSCT